MSLSPPLVVVLSPSPPRPVLLVVVVVLSLSLSLSSCRRRAGLVLVPLVPSSFPLPRHRVLVLFVVTCSTHDPSCEQWLAAMGVAAGSFHRRRCPPLPGFLVLVPLLCSSSSSCRGRPRPLVSSWSSSSSWPLAPLVRPRTPTVHPARSCSQWRSGCWVAFVVLWSSSSVVLIIV